MGDNSKLPYRYVMTYETKTDGGKLAVRTVDFRAARPISSGHLMETAEVLISVKREGGRPVQIVYMQPMFRVRAAEFRPNDERYGGA